MGHNFQYGIIELIGRKAKIVPLYRFFQVPTLKLQNSFSHFIIKCSLAKTKISRPLSSSEYHKHP